LDRFPPVTTVPVMGLPFGSITRPVRLARVNGPRISPSTAPASVTPYPMYSFHLGLGDFRGLPDSLRHGGVKAGSLWQNPLPYFTVVAR